MSQVEQPADLQVVGELLEILGEVLDRQAGTAGIGVDGRGRDGKDAGAFSPTHDAIVVLAQAQGIHALEVNHTSQRAGCKLVLTLDDRSQLLQDLGGPSGLAFVIQQRRLQEQKRDRRRWRTLGDSDSAIDDLDASIARAAPRLADFFQRRGRVRGLHHLGKCAKSAGIQRLAAVVS